MSINPTQLRSNLYQILDQIISTEEPVEIIRNNKILEISIKKNPTKAKLDTIKPHYGTIKGDADQLLQNDWLADWTAGKDL